MIDRYSRPEMARLFSEEHRFACWLAVELSVVKAWAEIGRIPKEDYETIKRKASFDRERIEELEKITEHEVIAFIANLAENVGPEARFIHLGLTSSDIMDTALALQLRDAMNILLAGLQRLVGALEGLAIKHKRTLIMGRTHGIHAEPTSFGLKCALFVEEMRRAEKRLGDALVEISVGKISGVVGNYAQVQPEVERIALGELGLSAEPVASQVVARDRHAFLLSVLAILGGTIEKLALMIRLLQRTETSELEEPFREGQKGSSAMPHKRNPILSERMCGLARLLRSYAQAGMENIALWDERDISHSSVERIILSDSLILADYVVDRMCYIVKGLKVDPERMKANIERAGDHFYSQRLLHTLIEKGLTREEAYEIVQELSFVATQTGMHLKDLAIKDEKVGSLLSEEEYRTLWDLQGYLRWVDEIYDRIRPKA